VKKLALAIWVALVVGAGLLTAQPAAAPSKSSTLPLLTTLVNNSLKLADEDDPLQRARYCTDVADELAKSVSQASARKDHQLADRLAGYLDRVWQDGVGGNVQRIPLDTLDEQRVGEVKSLQQRADQINQDLEKRLQDAPGPFVAPPGIQMPKGFDKQADRNKSKGKSKSRERKDR
jgi:hypothetical protein